MVDIPDWISSTLAADGAAGQGALPDWIRALSPDATVAGPALVVTLADADGVVVWPAKRYDDFLAAAAEKRRQDESRTR